MSAPTNSSGGAVTPASPAPPHAPTPDPLADAITSVLVAALAWDDMTHEADTSRCEAVSDALSDAVETYQRAYASEVVKGAGL